ncbi:hypothetical protein DLAC_10496 [Tieghemostelium lacteum]|uniref:Chromo domain-containing protein n=1 Tax=Tieghemostelium lacteum TaxID=361077 RepID=A0A151Z4P7_TIELA|nr:hypothetical protein DLAC_10496 [Tieghemostelium lacteum]|eukprot:KYQ88915.1 hypothetical protein DLAC_10496 [Tieghemostelium lacteum]
MPVNLHNMDKRLTAMKVKEIREMVKDNVLDSQIRMAAQYNKKRVEVDIKENDLVMIKHKYIHTDFAKSLLIGKLENRNIGPFKVKKVFNNGLSIELVLPENMRRHSTFNVNQVIKYYESKEFNQDEINMPKPDIIDGKEEFEVEMILDHKPNFSRYLVKWKGYPNDQSIFCGCEKSILNHLELSNGNLLRNFLS